MSTVATPTLGDLIRQRVERTYEGNQAAFARVIKEDPSKVNRWIKGGVALPEAEARRRLAKELGLRHIDILVAAGELWPDELPEPGAPTKPFPASDPRSQIVDALVTLSDDEVGHLLATISFMRGGAR